MSDRRIVKISVFVLAIVALSGAAWSQAKPETSNTKAAALARNVATDPQWLLFVAKDESATEKKISEYINLRTDWKVTPRMAGKDGDDLILMVDVPLNDGDGESPTFRVFIDTQPSRVNGRGVASQRLIRVTAFLKLPDKAKTDAIVNKILNLNNVWMRSKWSPGRIYLDKDQDVMFESTVNIPDSNVPVHAEMVTDLTDRLRITFVEYFKRLAEVAPLR